VVIGEGGVYLGESDVRILISNLFRAVTLLVPADNAVDGDAGAGNVRLAAAKSGVRTMMEPMSMLILVKI